MPRPFKGGGRITRLSTLVFEQQRLDTEIYWADLTRRAGRDLEGFVREKHGKEDTGEAVADVRWQLEHVLKYLRTQLQVLRDNYHDDLNYTLQRITFGLTVFGIALAAVGVILAVPEDMKRAPLDRVGSLLR